MEKQKDTMIGHNTCNEDGEQANNAAFEELENETYAEIGFECNSSNNISVFNRT